MDKEIKKGFEKVKKKATKEESRLVRMDKKRDKACEYDKRQAKKRK